VEQQAVIVRHERQKEPDRQAVPYRVCPKKEVGLRQTDKDLPSVSLRRLVSAVRAVAEHEGPVHVALVTRRLLAVVGVGRAGHRIQAALESAVRAGVEAGDLYASGDFLDAPDRLSRTGLRLRDWGEVLGAGITVQHVPMEDRTHALYLQVLDGLAVAEDEAIVAAAKLLGFGRVTSNVREGFNEALDWLKRQDLFILEGGRLRLSGSAPVPGVEALIAKLGP
jgi:hypothetical protein